MRYPSIRMSEVDATMVKWQTCSIDKDGKKKRMEEQKAAQVSVELMTQTATDQMCVLWMISQKLCRLKIVNLSL